MKEMGFLSVFGDHDSALHYEIPENFRRIAGALHERLQGSGVTYALTTKHH